MYRLMWIFGVCVLCAMYIFSKGAYAQKPTNLFIPYTANSSMNEEQPTEDEEIHYDEKYTEVKGQLVSELSKISGIEYTTLTYEWLRENDQWIYGHVSASMSNQQLPDSYNFLVKTDSSPIEVAYMYSNKFDEWLDTLPEEIIPSHQRIYFYSSKKYASIANTEQVDEPRLSFPWREGIAWRFSSGPHNYNGEGHNEHPWSGLDFGVPYSSNGLVVDDQVISSQEGAVLYKEYNCLVVIGIAGGWQVRYLHIKDITVGNNQEVDRGTPIAKVNLTNPCYLTTGPHLHIDLKKDGQYKDFDGHYIGGWLVHQGSSPYEGSLTLSVFAALKRNTARTGNTASYVKNLGAIGDDWFHNLVAPTKPNGGVTVCNAQNCFLATEGTTLSQNAQREAKQLIFSKGFKVEFRAAASFIASTESQTTATFSCLDFDVNDLQNYYFPGTEASLSGSSIETVILVGTCNPSDRPTKKGTTTSPTDPGTNEDPTSYTNCNGQTSGVMFYNKSNSCFYMPAGKSTLPFSPNRIQVLDANRDYDITLCNANNRCDEFHKSGDIDYSSVSRPFVRAEVSPQGLVSSDAIASCKTSTGRKVEFATLQAGVRYYTDRSHTIKNIDKQELIGMRFLKTPNDDKANADPEYLTCDVKKATQIIVGIDRRYKSLPGWMKNSSYTYINREIGVTDNDQQNFQLFYCTQAAGVKLRLGGPLSDGAAGTKSNYIVIFKEGDASKSTDCSAQFNVPPDIPVMDTISSSQPLHYAPLLTWMMSDRNSTDQLQAYVSIWKEDQLLSIVDWLPIGVTQWIPPWNEPGTYKAQVTVRDQSGSETISNQIEFVIVPDVNACSLVLK